MSIFKKISILFIISLLLMSVIGLWIDSINSKRIDALIKDKYIKVANELLANLENEKAILKTLKKYDLEKITKDDSTTKVLYHKNHTFGFIKILKGSFEDEFLIKVKYLDEELILETKDEQNLKDKMILNALIFLDIFVLLLIFLYILKLLFPLKKITQQIQNFSAGDLSSRIDISSKDEIGVLSKSFNKMASSLETLITTREELLRDIGHELRTPIAKGKFAIEKIDDFSQKNLLKTIFSDLEILTNELIELEKLNSNKLNITTFSAETLVLQSLSKLCIEDENSVDIKIVDDFKLQADLDYLCTALKNLIDNALKYSTKLPVIITARNNEISVCNYGEKLSKDLDYYLKPFTQESQTRDGFGLGLSIVEKILKKHNFNLEYEHKNSSNTFRIIIK